MKYVFVVEAISSGRYYVREAAERGCTPVVLFPRMAAEAAHYAPFRASVEKYLKQYTEHVYYLDDDERDGTALLEKFRPEAIVAGSEVGVALCDLLARKAGLPGNDPATSAVRRDKYAMAAAVERAGVPSLISRRVKNPDEALAAAREIDSWPVVIKPLEGAGSLGVSICGSMDELRERCARLLRSEDLFGQPCREALVQEYAAGTEYIVNTVSCGGRHYLTDMWRYRKIKIADRGNAYDHALLVSEPTAEERELFEYVKSCLDALGFEYGPSHTEAMITPKGPRLIEAGARPMGSIFDIDVFHEATGHRIVDLALDSVLEPEKLRARMEKPYGTLKSLMIMCLRSKVSMTNVASAPLKNILKYVGTVRVADLSPFESKRELRETIDLASLPGELYLCGDEKSLRRDYEALLKLEEEGFEYLFGREELMLDEPRAALRRGCEERQILRGGGKTAWTSMIEALGEASREVGAEGALAISGAAPETSRALSMLLPAFGLTAAESSGDTEKWIRA